MMKTAVKKGSSSIFFSIKLPKDNIDKQKIKIHCWKFIKAHTHTHTHTHFPQRNRKYEMPERNIDKQNVNFYELNFIIRTLSYAF